MSESFQNCPKCGRLISATATTCQHCGAVIEAPVYDNLDGNNSGQGPQSEVADVVAKRFNWGAFFFDFIWCIVYKQYIWAVVMLACSFIPVVNILGCLGLKIYFGIKGNTWAWQAKHYKSVEEFHKIHRIWARCGLIIIGGFFFLGFIAGMTIPTLMNSTASQQNKVGIKKSIAVLYQGSQLLTVKEEKLNDFSSEGLASHFHTVMNGEQVTDTITMPDGIVYKFVGNGDCTSDGCYVTVDVNGAKGPNKEWTDPNHPTDMVNIPIRNEDSLVKIYSPEILTKAKK